MVRLKGNPCRRNYRGRKPKRKIVLTTGILLVFLAIAVTWLLQNYIVYDAMGTPRMEPPWRDDSALDEELVEWDLIVQEPLVQAQTRAFCVPVGQITRTVWDHARATAHPFCDAVAVTLKDSTGKVYFDSLCAVPDSISMEEDTAETLKELQETCYAIACVSCFHDSEAANAEPEDMGLKNTDGYIFYDGNNSQWLDPGKSAARKYLCELAQEIAEMGFNEILLTDVGYPTEGKLDKIDWSYATNEKDSVEAGRTFLLETFLRELRSTLEPYGTLLSVQVSVDVMTSGATEDLKLTELAPLVDRIYAAVLPEEVDHCAATVAAAHKTTEFVPILTAPANAGSWLLQG